MINYWIFVITIMCTLNFTKNESLPSTFDIFDQAEIVAYRKEDYQYKILVKDRKSIAQKYSNAIIEPATIEEIMLFYVKGELQ